MKTPKAPPVPPKRRPGRPRKSAEGRVQSQAWLPAELVAQLDAYVEELKKDRPGASRGDVLADALRAHRAFRLWLLRRP